MTLTEFILARIAEDEEDLQEPTGADYCDDNSGSHYSNARVLAECEAKRQIVAECGVLSDDSSDSAWWSIERADRILAALALPYADHADYREEWKP